MGLHGKGIFGMSVANVKGHKRGRCPVCGTIEVLGARWNRHTWKVGEDGKVVMTWCPHECPRCHKPAYGPDTDVKSAWDRVCRACSYNNLAEHEGSPQPEPHPQPGY